MANGARRLRGRVAKKNEIILFEAKDGKVALPVQFNAETVWLTQAQMAMLFNKDRTVIGRHIRNAIAEGEIDTKTMCAKFAHVGKDADQTYWTEAYNLDVIISVGYRVKSQRGVEFRRWATKVLKDYLVRGYAANKKRLHQLGQAVEVMKRVSNSLDAEQVLDVVKTYSTALNLLDGYDHQSLAKPKAMGRSVEITYEECRHFIDSMKFSDASALFGNEKDGSFKSALGVVFESPEIAAPHLCNHKGGNTVTDESDWNLFRKRLPGWQERYMRSLLDEYAAIITANDQPSIRFWKLEKRLRTDVRHVGVQAEMSRSKMHLNLLSLLHEKAITVEDLDGFSDELKQRLNGSKY